MTNETLAQQTTQLLQSVAIPVTALIGACFYVLYGALLCTSNLIKQTKYNLLFYKILNLTLFNLISTRFQNNDCHICTEIVYGPYWCQVVQFYFSKCALNILRLAICFFEVIIAFNRYCVLTQRKSVIFKLPMKYSYLICLLVCSILIMPVLVTQQIVYSPGTGSYYIANSLVRGNWYFWYIIASNSIIRLFTVVVLSVLNTLNIIEYKRFIIKKARVIRRTGRFKAEVVFTRMIIIDTFLFIIGFIGNIVSFVVAQLSWLNGAAHNSVRSQLIAAVSYELLLLIYIADIFIYLAMDTNLKKKALKRLCRKLSRLHT